MADDDKKDPSYAEQSAGRSEASTGGNVGGAKDTASKGSFNTQGKVVGGPQGIKSSGGIQSAGSAQQSSNPDAGNDSYSGSGNEKPKDSGSDGSGSPPISGQNSAGSVSNPIRISLDDLRTGIGTGSSQPDMAPPWQFPKFKGADDPQLRRKIESQPTSSDGNPGLLIYRAGETEPDFIPKADILAGYDPEDDDNWSLKLGVTNGRLDDFETTAPVGTSSTEIYDGDATADPVEDQTYYRMAVVRTLTVDEDPVKLAWDISGIYRENVVCTATGPKIELIRIG